MEYLLKASAVICIFYICFQLLLKRETFFNHNRWFLIIGLVLALIFPLIVIPVYVPVETIVKPEFTFQIGDASINNSNIENKDTFQWALFLTITYIIGFGILFLQFLFQFGSLVWLLLKYPKNKEGIYTYVIVNHKISPFSFFKWIVFNPKNYTNDELELILKHEKVHVNQMHTLDILFSHLACVIFWFNPLIWFYKKEVRQNLEYIADYETQSISKDDKAYQHLLLKTSINNTNISLSNNFYNSQIKKRIIMLHKSKSHNKNQWKYLLVLPILAGLLMSMNTEKVYIDNSSKSYTTIEATQSNVDKTILDLQPKAISNINASPVDSTPKAKNEKKPSSFKGKISENSKSKINSDISITIIDKNTTDAELDRIKEDLEKEGLTVKFKGVKRNNKGEIRAIKIEAKSENSSTSYNISSDDEAIKPIKIVYDQENNSISIGNGDSKHKANTYFYKTDNGGTYKIRSSSGNNLFFSDDKELHFSDDQKHEHKKKIIIKEDGKKGKVKTIELSEDIEVISDDDEIIEVIVEDDGNTEDEIIIVNGKKLKTTSDKDVEVIVKEKNNKNVWVTKTDDKDKSYIIELDDSKNNIFILDENGKSPLFIIDDKEVSKEKFKDLDPEQIESVTVLKDESATKKYGDKGKDGVIIVKTKKN